IEATAEYGAVPENLPERERHERMRPMLQALLADRFKLSIRRETKELPVYKVTVAKGGPKLQRAGVSESECPPVPATFEAACHVFRGGIGQGLDGRAIEVRDLVSGVRTGQTDPSSIKRESKDSTTSRPKDGCPCCRVRPVLLAWNPALKT